MTSIQPTDGPYLGHEVARDLALSNPHQLMTTTTTASTAFEVLGHELELDQLADIATHGMAQGVAGFVYSSDLHDLFEANEDEIMAYLDEHAFDLGEQNGFRMVLNAMDRQGIEYDSLQVFKEHAVWMFVELFAYQLCVRNEHPDFL